MDRDLPGPAHKTGPRDTTNNSKKKKVGSKAVLIARRVRQELGDPEHFALQVVIRSDAALPLTGSQCGRAGVRPLQLAFCT